MPFKIIRDDITRISADAIVNTANPLPEVGSGTDTAIYDAAGRTKMLSARLEIGRIAPGEAEVTPGYDLAAKYVIHTVGPSWQGGECGELKILASCYRNSLALAERLGCESIAFPLISTGNYGVPKELALNTALREIEVFLNESTESANAREMDVTLVVFDRESFKLSSGLVEDVNRFIDENYVAEAFESEYREGFGRGNVSLLRGSFREAAVPDEKAMPLFAPRDASYMERQLEAEETDVFAEEENFDGSSEDAVYDDASDETILICNSLSLEDVLNEGLGQTFQEKLLRFIDEKGYTDTEVYKRANVDRKVFSKIRSNVNYQPKKKTALAFILALGLNLDEAVDLLGRAGLAFSPSDKRDVIVQYCIINGIYNIYDVDALLFNYDLQPLGA